MLDIGSWEFLIVAIVALIVIGPKDLPGLVRNVSQWVRRAKDLAREFQNGLEDMAREAELDKVQEELKAELDPEGIANSIRDDLTEAIDGDGEMRRELAGEYDLPDSDVEDEYIEDEDPYKIAAELAPESSENALPQEIEADKPSPAPKTENG